MRYRVGPRALRAVSRSRAPARTHSKRDRFNCSFSSHLSYSSQHRILSMHQLFSSSFCLIKELWLLNIFTKNTREWTMEHGDEEKKDPFFHTFVSKTREKDERIGFDPLFCSTVVRFLGLRLTPRAIEIPRPSLFIVSHSILPSFHIIALEHGRAPPSSKETKKRGHERALHRFKQYLLIPFSVSLNRIACWVLF